MAALQLRNIEKTYSNGAVRVIHGINLDIEDGEFIVFVGPSGCGKSTTLRMIAGLEEITGGDLHIDAKRVNDMPAAKRGVAMVFQSYALYPHMTVAENLGFALKLAGKTKAEIAEASDKAARILQLEPLLHRKPKELSGGQRQRVAIGRCIVRQPKVFLFDEPLSNLDAALRVQMRAEIARLHQELGTTMVYVTHDQVEAMTLGDRIAVFNQGIIEQCGSPRELYETPANLFVATFIGSPSMNLLAVDSHKTDAGIQLSLPGGARWTLPAGSHDCSKLGDKLTLGLRPENLTLTSAQQGIPAIAGLVEYHGGEQIVYTTLKGTDSEVTVKLGTGSAPIKMGEAVGIQIDPEHFHLFDAAGKSIPRSRL